jgi:hypothetical protein
MYMDTYVSANEIARRLGTNADRVLRTARSLRMKTLRAGNASNSAVLFTQPQFEILQRELSSGLTTPQSKVLSAIVSAPRGLLSDRAVARKAGVSPTTAGRAIADLEKVGRVERVEVKVVMGRVRQATVIRATSPSIEAVKDLTDRRSGHQVMPSRRVPFELRHLFWNTHPDQLKTQEAGGYIARRLIQSKSPDGIAWGAENLSRDDWEHAATARGLDPALRQLALNLAKQAP